MSGIIFFILFFAWLAGFIYAANDFRKALVDYLDLLHKHEKQRDDYNGF